MSNEIRITVLVENSVHQRDLQAEHGLSFHLQAGGHSMLFDTGQTGLLLRNAEVLRIPLDRIEAVALSHGHYDHTGGLPAVMRKTGCRARLFLHPAALLPKFTGNADGTSRPVGMNAAVVQAVRDAAADVVRTIKPTEVLDGIFVTGAIPRQNAYEDTGGRFFLDEACTQPDPLMDDQALFFDTPDGLVVVMGCGHAGVVNTLEYIRRITHSRPVHTVLGGMHLLTASPERIAKTVETFRRLDIKQIAPAHCTGMPAVAQLWTSFPGCCFPCAVGVSMVFQN
jgi:7,8-dihydropterin-6-yl-methyl-4-(beta-D-ribofuranosyl)aminobenzene 5'-phosphate synthase